MSIEALEQENAELRAKIKALTAEKAELKAATYALEEQIEIMETIFNGLNDGVVAIDLTGNFLAINDSVLTMMGIDGRSEEDTGLFSLKTPFKAYYPDRVTLQPMSEAALFRAMTGEVVKDDLVFITVGGSNKEGVLTNCNARPLYDRTGNVSGAVAVLEDVTELKKTEEQLENVVRDLEKQTQLMDTIFNSISDGIVVANEEGEYVLFNEAAKRMAEPGTTEDVRVGEAPTTFGLFRTDGKSPFPVEELPIAQALQGKKADNVEIVIRNARLPKGLHTSISGHPIYDSAGNITGAVAAIRDITQLKVAERQLKRINNKLTDQNELLQSIFNSMSDGVAVADKSGDISIINPSAERISGMSKTPDADECFYPDGVTHFPPEELPLNQALRGTSTDNVQMFVRNDRVPDGVYLNVNGRPLRDSNGNQRGGVIVYHDVTDRIRAEEALEQAFRQGRIEILDTILHNIGNAINSVAVGIDSIYMQMDQGKFLPRFRALVSNVEQHKDDFADYIANDPQGQKVAPFLLALSQDLEAGTTDLKELVTRSRRRTLHIVDIVRTQKLYHGPGSMSKDVNLLNAISDAVKILQDSIDNRGIRIEIDCKDAPTDIRIQESQFHQMLINITKNAIESIDELMEIKGLRDVPSIRFRAYLENDYLCIDVTDTGIGIAPDVANKIFSAGFTTKSSGNGLGLHSSANFVIGAGGKIQPMSEGKGKGATMRILLDYKTVQLSRSKRSLNLGS